MWGDVVPEDVRQDRGALHASLRSLLLQGCPLADARVEEPWEKQH